MTFERACINNGLIIDTNLLILLLVGYYDIDFIKTCTKTNEYDKSDFIYIASIIKELKPKIIVTPHILTELSNLTFKKMLSGDKFNKYFQEVCALLELADERHIGKDTIMRDSKLLASFGFTDLSIIEAAKKHGYAVITDDNPFYVQLLNASCVAENLNNARALMATIPS